MATLLVSSAAFSQTHSLQHPQKVFQDPGHLTCDKNHYTEAFFEAHPEEIVPAMMAREQLEDFTRDYQEDGLRTTLIVPVVFHIVHANGTENISNAQIESAIDVLNEDFNGDTPNIGLVNDAFSNVVGDVDIEFRLARKDPSGNCTNGIRRVISSTTFSGGLNLASVAGIWPRNRYLNVFICATLSGGAAGFTLIPSSVNGSQGANIDGIYITHPYVGRIGTGNSTRSHALSHEVGHWLNLEHTWGVSNVPALASNCNGDDGVADTPNTVGWTTCNLSGASCGSLDNVENFMDYAYCYKMFTAGQSTRMRAALNSSIAQRSQLHTNSNLTFTGVNLPDQICEADFQVVSDPSVCAGAQVEFQDLSFNGVTSRTWTFAGGTPSTSTQANPVVTYNNQGTYAVSLTVTNPQGSMSVTKNSAVSVINVAQNVLPFEENFESFNALHAVNGWFVNNPDGNTTQEWELYQGVGFSGSKSSYVHGRFNSNGAVENLDSPTFDLSELSENAVLRFKYAHARRNSNSDDMMRIWISRNCGENWSLRRTITMDELPTVSGNNPGEFAPSSQNQWGEVEIDNIVSVFLTDEFRVRIEFTSFQGNNCFIDDLNIYDPLTLTTNQELLKESMDVYPNPSRNSTILEYSILQSAKVSVELMDVSGKVIDALFSGDRAPGKYLHSFDVNHLAPGMYFIRLMANGESGVQKLVVH
jgi:PKD repeat protein